MAYIEHEDAFAFSHLHVHITCGFLLLRAVLCCSSVVTLCCTTNFRTPRAQPERSAHSTHGEMRARAVHAPLAHTAAKLD